MLRLQHLALGLAESFYDCQAHLPGECGPDLTNIGAEWSVAGEDAEPREERNGIHWPSILPCFSKARNRHF